MKRKHILPLFVLLTSLSVTACDVGGERSEVKKSSTEDSSSVQLIRDNIFKNGFSCSPSSGQRQEDGWVPEDKWTRDVDLQYGDYDNGPSWMLSQHGDIYSLNDKYNKYVGEKPIDNGDGSYTFFDESKKIVPNPSKGSLYMELNTSKEYVRPRREKEQWCHILLNQGFTESVSLSEVSSVDFTIDLEMKKCEDHMDGQANPSLHTIQFLMYIVVKSVGGLDAGNWFWFGIPFYDYRYPLGLAESGMIDAGGAGATSKFIYGMDSSTYLPGGLKLNEKASIEIEVSEAIGRGLLKAQSMGFLTNSTIDDLMFSSMNIGFEIPGTYDCGIEISNFSLIANY